MSHATQTVRPPQSQTPDQDQQPTPVQQQAPKVKLSTRSALYVNGGARERARLVDPDLASGRPRSRSRWYAK